jgi:hypothetical protein
MTSWDCGNCNHHWQAGQYQEFCPKCNSWHVMTTNDWSVDEANDELKDKRVFTEMHEE